MGELSLGGTPPDLLRDLDQMLHSNIATYRSQMAFIRDHRVSGRRVGWVDSQLLLVAFTSNFALITADQYLARMAHRLEVPCTYIP